MREPPSRKEISPKTSPGPGVSSTMRSPVSSLKKTSTLPSRITYIVPPGSFDLEDELAGGDAHLVELPGQDLALVFVEILEERYTGEQRRVGRHRILLLKAQL